MTLTDLLQSQLLEPFRIGLIIALLYTAVRNQPVTGMLIPLAAGVVFVAVIIPTTMGLGAGASLGQVIGVGLVANVLILAVALAAWRIIERFRG